MIKAKSILFFLIVVFSLQLQAQSTQVDINMAKQVAKVFLSDNVQCGHGLEEKATVLFADDFDMPNAYIFKLEPQGFVIVSSTNIVSPILAFSLENDFAGLDSFEGNIAQEIVKGIVANDLVRETGTFPKKVNNSGKVQYGPYVYTMWGQVNCYDNMGHLINVSNIFTPNHYAPGCVAVSQISVMHHFNWPPRGNGSHSYNDNSGSSTGYYAANYGDSQYDWPMMLDRYRSKASTVEQREPVGDLCFDVAVSLNMDFEPNGSTSNVNRIPGSFADYFRFTSLYRDKNASSFWSLLDSNMAYKKPAVLAISASFGGHSVVCDGLKIEDGNQYFYHLNMGWWGVSNGWYKIRGSFNAGNYTTIDGAVMNIIPEPYVIAPEISSDSTVTKIYWMYPENAEAEAFELQVSINGGNWQTLSDNSTDTCFNLAPNIEKTYKYRVRAKTNGHWYSNSWGNEVSLHVNYTSIQEKTGSIVKAFPNPFSTKLTLNFKNAHGAGTVEIFDIFGKKIYAGSFLEHDADIIIDSNDWDKGIYFVKVGCNNLDYSAKAVKN